MILFNLANCIRLPYNEIRAEITGRLGYKRQKMDEKQKRKSVSSVF